MPTTPRAYSWHCQPSDATAVLSVEDCLAMILIREDIRKKHLSFGQCPKGGVGVQPEAKSF